jgi:hypothetical protein
MSSSPYSPGKMNPVAISSSMKRGEEGDHIHGGNVVCYLLGILSTGRAGFETFEVKAEVNDGLRNRRPFLDLDCDDHGFGTVSIISMPLHKVN